MDPNSQPSYCKNPAHDRLLAVQTDESPSHEKDYNQQLDGPPELGILREKKYLATSDALACLLSLTCLAGAVITVSPQYSGYLGFQHQFQIIGALLNIMNLCLLALAPKVFILLEAQVGFSSP